MSSHGRKRKINNINEANHSQRSQKYTTYYTRVCYIRLTLWTYYSTKQTTRKHLNEQLTKTVWRCGVFLFTTALIFIAKRCSKYFGFIYFILNLLFVSIFITIFICIYLTNPSHPGPFRYRTSFNGFILLSGSICLRGVSRLVVGFWTHLKSSHIASYCIRLQWCTSTEITYVYILTKTYNEYVYSPQKHNANTRNKHEKSKE